MPLSSLRPPKIKIPVEKARSDPNPVRGLTPPILLGLALHRWRAFGFLTFSQTRLSKGRHAPRLVRSEPRWRDNRLRTFRSPCGSTHDQCESFPMADLEPALDRGSACRARYN